jgi:hypothetical protein
MKIYLVLMFSAVWCLPTFAQSADQLQSPKFNRAQSLTNSFQVICGLTLPKFSNLDAYAAALKLRVLSDTREVPQADAVGHQKSWLGSLTSGPFALFVEEMSGSKGTATSCAVAGDVPDPDQFRGDATALIKLPPEPQPELSSDGSRSWIWPDFFGQNTLLILRDYKLIGKTGVILKLTSMVKK